MHQSFPFIDWPIELIALYVNGGAFRKFDAVIIPDNPPGPLSLPGNCRVQQGQGLKNWPIIQGFSQVSQKSGQKRDPII